MEIYGSSPPIHFLGHGKEFGCKGEFVRNEKETLWAATETHSLSLKLITGAFCNSQNIWHTKRRIC